MSGLGILASGVAGGAQAVGWEAQQAIETQNKINLTAQIAEMEKQKLSYAEKLKVDAEIAARARMVSDINAGIPAAAQGMLSNKYAGSDAAVAAANAGQTDAPLTAEQQGVIDQSKASDLHGMLASPEAWASAARQAGYVNPNVVEQTSQRLAAAESALRWHEAGQQTRAQSAVDVAHINATSREAAAQTRADAYVQFHKAMSPTDRAALANADTYVKEAKDLKAQGISLSNQLANMRPKDPAYAATQAKIAEIQNKAEGLYAQARTLYGQSSSTFQALQLRNAAGQAADDAGVDVDSLLGGKASSGPLAVNPGVAATSSPPVRAAIDKFMSTFGQQPGQ